VKFILRDSMVQQLWGFLLEYSWTVSSHSDISNTQSRRLLYVQRQIQKAKDFAFQDIVTTLYVLAFLFTICIFRIFR
jgi:hypothetical protein